MMAWGRPLLRSGMASSRLMTVTRKAAVLPVPVWAWPATSRPCSRTGRASAWMGVQNSNPASASPRCTSGGRSKESNRVSVRNSGLPARGVSTRVSGSSDIENRSPSYRVAAGRLPARVVEGLYSPFGNLQAYRLTSGRDPHYGSPVRRSPAASHPGGHLQAHEQGVFQGAGPRTGARVRASVRTRRHRAGARWSRRSGESWPRT